MGKPLPVPPAWYTGFARWHRLSLMRAPRTLRDIAEVARTAEHPERLHHLIAADRGGGGLCAVPRRLRREGGAVAGAGRPCCASATKDFVVDAPITRADFEAWIAPDLARLGGAVDQALAEAGLPPEQIDRVFLTGGTSLVPAVRQLFEDRFGRRQAGGGRRIRRRWRRGWR